MDAAPNSQPRAASTGPHKAPAVIERLSRRFGASPQAGADLRRRPAEFTLDPGGHCVVLVRAAAASTNGCELVAHWDHIERSYCQLGKTPRIIVCAIGSGRLPLQERPDLHRLLTLGAQRWCECVAVADLHRVSRDHRVRAQFVTELKSSGVRIRAASGLSVEAQSVV